jgi:VanZ family protein
MSIRIPIAPRLCFYAAAILVGALSLAPGGILPAAEVGDKLEHLLAYAALGFIGVATARSRRRAAATILGIIAFGMAIELLQLFSPGRLAEFGDAVADAAGAAIGGLIATALRRRRMAADAG